MDETGNPIDPTVSTPLPARPVGSTPAPATTDPGVRTLPAGAPGPTAPPPTGYIPRFGNIGTYLAARFAAFLVDVFVIAFIAATFLFNVVFSHLINANASPLLALGVNVSALQGAFQGSFVALAAGSFAIAILFIWICETVLSTSLGKLFFGLAIRRATGGWAHPGRVLMRNVLRPIDALVIGALLGAVTPKHQRIGDFAGGTIVVRSALGLLAPFVAALGFIIIGFMQLTYGGGLGSAAGVITQSAIALPRIITRLHGDTGTASPAPSPTPTTAPAAAPVTTDAPSGDETPAP